MDPLYSNDPVSPTGSSVPPVPEPFSVAKEQRLWGMLAHLTALSGLVGVPFGHILGPLIIWLIKKNELSFVDDQGKEALNFQITMTIIAVVFIPLVFVFIGIFLLIGLYFFVFVLTIVAAIKANDGIAYRYPLTWRIIK